MPLFEISQSHDHFAFPGCAIGKSQRGRRGTNRTRIRAALTIQGRQNEVLCLLLLIPASSLNPKSYLRMWVLAREVRTTVRTATGRLDIVAEYEYRPTDLRHVSANL